MPRDLPVSWDCSGPLATPGPRLLIDEERSPVHDVVSSGGTPLPGDVRADMEGRFGTDFGDVRVHNDGAAHDSAKSVNAQAYTVGSNIVFQRDKYDPASDAGKHMIAHELTHVVQQRNGPVDGSDAGGGVKISDPSDRFERDAVANADRLMAAPAPPLGAVPRRPTPPRERRLDDSASGRSRGGRGDGADVRPASRGRKRRRVGLTEMTEPARAVKPVSDALADGKRKASRGPAGVGPGGLAALQRAAGNSAVNALLAARMRWPSKQAVRDINGALKELRRDEPAIDTVEKGLKAAKGVGIPVDLEGIKPPPSALAVTTTGFGPAAVAPKKTVPPPKPVPAVSPLGKAAAKPAKAKPNGGAPRCQGTDGGGRGRRGCGRRPTVGRPVAAAAGGAENRCSGPGSGLQTGHRQGQGLRQGQARTPACGVEGQGGPGRRAGSDRRRGGAGQGGQGRHNGRPAGGHVRQEGVYRGGQGGHRGEVTKDPEGGRHLREVGQGRRGEG